MKIELKKRPLFIFQPRFRGEKEVMVSCWGKFDALQVGATTPASSIQIVRKIGKAFVIDPMAYMLTLDPERIKDKKTDRTRKDVLSLAERYQQQIAAIIGKRILTHHDFLDQLETLTELTINSLDYQRSKLSFGDLDLFNQYYEKYRNLAAPDDNISCEANAVSPAGLLAPFFYFEGLNDPWYRANLRSVRLACSQKEPGESVFQVIFTGTRSLNSRETIEKICVDYSKTGADGTFVWINRWDEETGTVHQILNFIDLVRTLSVGGKPVFKMFGGYLSGALYHHGLSGFSCSLSYRSSKDIFGFGWRPPQPPQSKYYVPKLRKSLPLEEALLVMKVDPAFVCSCPICVDGFGKNLDRFISSMRIKGNCQKHFLHTRWAEVQEIGKTEMPDILHGMDETYARLNGLAEKNFSYLKKWSDSLRTWGVFRNQGGVQWSHPSQIIPTSQHVTPSFIRLG